MSNKQKTSEERYKEFCNLESSHNLDKAIYDAWNSQEDHYQQTVSELQAEVERLKHQVEAKNLSIALLDKQTDEKAVDAGTTDKIKELSDDPDWETMFHEMQTKYQKKLSDANDTIDQIGKQVYDLNLHMLEQDKEITRISALNLGEKKS